MSDIYNLMETVDRDGTQQPTEAQHQQICAELKTIQNVIQYIIDELNHLPISDIFEDVQHTAGRLYDIANLMDAYLTNAEKDSHNE
jgi:hypothetical protein